MKWLCCIAASITFVLFLATIAVWVAAQFRGLRYVDQLIYVYFGRRHVCFDSNDYTMRYATGWSTNVAVRVPRSLWPSYRTWQRRIPFPSGPTVTTWRVLVPYWLMTVIGGVATVAFYLRARRPRRGFCKTCGYNLTGNVSGICPECGRRISSAEAPDQRT